MEPDNDTRDCSPESYRREIARLHMLCESTRTAADRYCDLLDSIRAALDTQETGEALVQVARNAAECKLELARLRVRMDEEAADAKWNDRG